MIVAVHDDWGIGRDGTQPITLRADRAFFREITRGAMVISGRRTILDFPEQKPLPGRTNVALTRTEKKIPGFTVRTSPEEAAELAKTADKCFVIGGGSIYRQMLAYCDTAYVTKIHTSPRCDTWFPDLDAMDDWYLAVRLQSGTEDGIEFEILQYKRRNAGEK